MSAEETHKSIKCVVWDLDDTLWHGTLLEDASVQLRSGVPEIIRVLDQRGILQSISSKNDHELAMTHLKSFDLAEYFLYPQINWSSKSAGVKEIAAALNISADSVAFIDDQPFERDEVNSALPEVLCLDVASLDQLLEMPEMMPRFVTNESRLRRQMYLTDIERKSAETAFTGPAEEFLASLEMEFSIQLAQEGDLQRLEELTLRTHQLNTTGYTFSYDELSALLRSPEHLLLVAELNDKYGTYGKVGLALVECRAEVWNIKLLLMSCRVMSRGVGAVLLTFITRLAIENRVRLQAEFISNDRNRMMYVTYKFNNFRELERTGKLVIFENPLLSTPDFPDYIRVKADGALRSVATERRADLQMFSVT